MATMKTNPPSPKPPEQAAPFPPREFPHTHERDIEKACREALELGAKSTDVVGWYAYSQYDSYRPGCATVRGPFFRWLVVEKGSGWDKNKPEPVADQFDDAKFAAHAMTNVEAIASAYLKLKEEHASLIRAARADGIRAAAERLMIWRDVAIEDGRDEDGLRFAHAVEMLDNMAAAAREEAPKEKK